MINNTVIVEYAVTASGGNFLIDGEANATISFSPGIVYRFDLSDNSVTLVIHLNYLQQVMVLITLVQNIQQAKHLMAHKVVLVRMWSIQ